jgi:hypothetical protein
VALAGSDEEGDDQGGGAQGWAHRSVIRAAARDDDDIVLVEAALVPDAESEGRGRQDSVLVVARPIRRKRQAAIIGAFLLVVAGAIVGLAVGLASKSRDAATDSSPSSTDPPTPSPTSRIDQEFRPTLPLHTLASLRNASSPQYRAYEWATERDLDPWLKYPSNGDGYGKDVAPRRRLRSMQRRFALATLYFATGGDTSWSLGLDDSGDDLFPTYDWLNVTASECQWTGCFCMEEDYDDTGDMGLELTSVNLRGSLPHEVTLLSSVGYLNLQRNALTGSLPSELGNLAPRLLELYLNDNLFSGEIPPQLGLLTNLNDLRLDGKGFFWIDPHRVRNAIAAIGPRTERKLASRKHSV